MKKECKIHGMTYFMTLKENGKVRYRCSKCAGDAVSKRRKKLKLEAINYMGGECYDCSYNKNVAALEFHHIDPTVKEFGISGSGITRSFEKMKTELDKCIMLCANCHREEHSRLDDGLYEMTPMGTSRMLMLISEEVNT